MADRRFCWKIRMMLRRYLRCPGCLVVPGDRPYDENGVALSRTEPHFLVCEVENRRACAWAMAPSEGLLGTGLLVQKAGLVGDRRRWRIVE
jgi:hypothetical protein